MFGMSIPTEPGLILLEWTVRDIHMASVVPYTEIIEEKTIFLRIFDNSSNFHFCESSN